MGRQRKSKIKKKGNTIKNLNQRILQVFYNNPNKNFNHKQIAAKLDIQDSEGRNQIIRALKEMEAGDRLDEVTRGKYVLVKQTHLVLFNNWKWHEIPFKALVVPTFI